tara:strand:- start:2274 stop:2765 length:492 start_codon:yes stop_codon:yes gene_type:complete
MTIDDKLANVPGDDNTDVTIEFEDQFHGRHYMDEFQEWGVASTETVDRLAEAMTHSELSLKTVWSKEDPVEILRDAGYLEDYERGTDGFQEYIATTIRENYWELDEILDLSTEQWDYKEGALHVSTEMKTTLGALRKARKNGFNLSGWSARVKSGPGDLDIKF